MSRYTKFGIVVFLSIANAQGIIPQSVLARKASGLNQFDWGGRHAGEVAGTKDWGPHEAQCGEVKDTYRDSSCCGNEENVIDTRALARVPNGCYTFNETAVANMSTFAPMLHSLGLKSVRLVACFKSNFASINLVTIADAFGGLYVANIANNVAIGVTGKLIVVPMNILSDQAFCATNDPTKSNLLHAVVASYLYDANADTLTYATEPVFECHDVDTHQRVPNQLDWVVNELWSIKGGVFPTFHKMTTAEKQQVPEGAWGSQHQWSWWGAFHSS